MTLTLITRPYR